MRHPINSESCSVTKEVSLKIANMSLLGALLVISIHCGYCVAESGPCWWVSHIFENGYSRIAVPFFFVVSGYFLAAHINDEHWWTRETAKRIKSLLVPFFAWAFIYQVIFIPLSVFADMRAGRAFGTSITFFKEVNILEVFGMQWDRWPTSVPLWFLRALFIYILISPIVVAILRRRPKVWLLTLFASTILLHYSIDPELGGWPGFICRVFSIRGLLYFSVGIFARITNVHYRSRRAANMGIGVGIVLLLINGIIDCYFVEPPIPIIEFAIPCFLYATWYYIPANPLPRFLSGVSFPIYLMHMCVMGYWGLVSKNLSVSEDATRLIAWPLSFVGCIVLANILRRFFPTVSKILFGGR